MQKYTILGIKLYDYGAREALRNTDSFLHNGALNTIAYISSSNLAQASKDEQLRECLEAVDMTICTEPDVLEAAGIARCRFWDFLVRGRQKGELRMTAPS